MYGLAIAGAATVRALRRRDVDVIVADDVDDDARRQLAEALGVELVAAPDDAAVDALVSGCDLVVPAPGVPEDHGVITSARAHRRSLVSEIELAYDWERERLGGPRRMLAVTGTDGKTTTTMLAVEMLRAAGVRAVAAGNTDVPLVEALELDVDVFVVECASFRLAWTEHFRGDAAVWLNLAPDHLNWHRSMASYEAAKARIFELQRTDDVAIGFADDATVMRHLAEAPGRRCTFASLGADYHRDGDELVGPHGVLASVHDLRRALPHDVTNSLAAAALVTETGLADAAAVRSALRSFVGPRHRIELVGEADGVRWFNDSKATTPHASSVAIRAFGSVVLIAGGLNKGLDLAPMGAQSARVRAVVAIGRDAPDISKTFGGAAGLDGPIEVVVADSMRDAVDLARRAALPGDTVLLSPGCASFDWYPDGGYPARGDDFRDEVRRLLDTPMPDHITTLERGGCR